MNKLVSLLGVAAALLLSFGSQAHAAQKYSYKTKGNTASYSAYSDSECGYEYLSVYVFEERVSGNQTAYDSVYLDYTSYDFCTGSYSYGYGAIDGTSFDVSKLKSASVDGSGSIELVTCNYGGMGEGDGGMEDPCVYSSATATVNLDWVGTGDTYKDRYVQVSSSPSSRYRYVQSGQSREATVSGSIAIDGSPLSLTSSYGSLNYSASSTFEIVR